MIAEMNEELQLKLEAERNSVVKEMEEMTVQMQNIQTKISNIQAKRSFVAKCYVHSMLLMLTVLSALLFLAFHNGVDTYKAGNYTSATFNVGSVFFAIYMEISYIKINRLFAQMDILFETRLRRVRKHIQKVAELSGNEIPDIEEPDIPKTKHDVKDTLLWIGVIAFNITLAIYFYTK